MAYEGSLIAALTLAALGAIAPGAPAWAADKVRIANLTDVAFGTVAGGADRLSSQNVCVFSDSFTQGYSVTANGSGGAFELASGGARLPYEVLWADAVNTSGGTPLIAGGTAGGFRSSASHQFCNSGPSASASLTIALRASALNSADAGSYSATLQITIAPE
jgi:hypothetical protein